MSFIMPIQNPYCDNCQAKSFTISCISRIQLNKQCVHLVKKKSAFKASPVEQSIPVHPL